MLKRFLIIFCFSFAGFSYAQDIHFSQYFLSPVATAVSNTGNHEGDWRVFANYRSQWSTINNQPYITPALGGDYNFYLNKVDKASVGAFIINDKSGGSLQVFKFMLSGAYHKELDGHFLHAGLQGGLVMKNINKDSEFYPNQFDDQTGYFNNKRFANNELGLTNNLKFIDINLGFGWEKTFGKLTPYANYTLFHLNQPKESFFKNGRSIIPLRHMINGGVKIPIGNKMAVHPSLNFGLQGRANELMIGGNFQYNLDAKVKSKKYVYIGQYLRYGVGNLADATFTTLGMGYKQLQFGISYDVNISQLKAATDLQGAYEFAIIYTGFASKLLKKQIPCDRL